MKDTDDFEGLLIEDISAEPDVKKKKVNGKNKGNRTELNLCKLLTKYFGKDFVRSVGSGNRWSQANLSETAKQVYSGDICVPEEFKWVIECKGGYEDDMHLENILNGDDGLSRLDEFIEQVSKDAEYCKRKPIILWKRNRKPWIAMIKSDECDHSVWECYIKYRDWSILNFGQLLNHTDKEFWFDED